MNLVLTIVVFILIFSLLILIHELGHFWMAKRAGIKVEEFGFGLPPRLWGKKKGETIYSINAIPFGGFVRMMGEDATDSKMLKKKRSFVAQPMRARVLVIVAGVVMNFLLAWVLLVAGFTVGMQPLLVPEDVLPAVNSGLIELEEGVKVKEVTPQTIASELGLEGGDVIYKLDGQPVDGFDFPEFLEEPSGTLSVMRKGVSMDLILEEQLLDRFDPSAEFGAKFYDYVAFPRVKIFEVDPGSLSYQAGLRSGDVVISINGRQVFSISEYEEVIRGQELLEYEVYRDGMKEPVILELSRSRSVVISQVLPGMPAESAGFREGDVVVSVNGKNISDSQELVSFVSEHPNETLAYLVERDGERIFLEVTLDETGKIGVLLSELMSYEDQQKISLYNADVLSSVVKINDEKYPFHVAMGKAFSESWRLSKLTAQMFGQFVGSVVSSGEVPEGVAGPVGIAQMTHVFVQEGFMSVLRFVAILSLSLAVINILPFPALDGGRLLFILIELVTGRRVNQKWESYIHALGYVLILLLILAVTYSDILRIFS